MAIEIGQHFREVGPGMFGRPGPEFVVEDVFVGIDRVHYGRVTWAHDASMHKTIALSALLDRRRYVPIPKL